VLIEELRQRRLEVRAELERIESAILTLTQLRGGPTGNDSGQRTLPGLDLRDLTYADATEAVLKRSERQPLTTKVLVKRLETGGRPVKGRDTYRILYRTLMKNARFKNVAGRWALAEWYPEEIEKLAKRKTR
jgi:hypothetical protein